MTTKSTAFLLTLIAAAGWASSPRVACGQNVGNSIPLVYDDGQGNTLPYRLFLPPGHDTPGESFPLTVFLHGSGQIGTDNVSQLLFIDGLVEATQSERFASFLLAPQSQPTQDGWGPLTRGLTKQVIEQLEQTYAIDASRRYLTGLSMGGFGTWGFLADYPDLFDAAVPMSAWGSPDDLEEYAETRLWSFHGRNDSLPAMYNRYTVLGTRLAGGSALYTETGGAHVIWEPIYDDPDDDLYPWLFEGVDPAMGTLYYDPLTGSVQIDANRAPGGAIDFLLLNSNPAAFTIPDTVYLDGVAIDTDAFFDSASETSIRYNDFGGAGFSGVLDLGPLLPTGLDFSELHDVFSAKVYRSPSTTALRYISLDVVTPIPEPSSLPFVGVAVSGLYVWRGRWHASAG